MVAIYSREMQSLVSAHGVYAEKVMAVDYKWRLRVLMAENGMFRAIDLAPRLAEHGGPVIGLTSVDPLPDV